MQWTRGKFSTWVGGGIISFIAFVFVVSGVFNPRSTRGLHEGAVAGTVNGEPISLGEFNRALNQRIEMFKGMLGGKVSDEQLKQFKIREGVFQELVRRKVMVQEAMRQGLAASDSEVQAKISEIPAFQKAGKFDLATYKATLEANSYSPANFEKLVREDLSLQVWQSYFTTRVRVSDQELKEHYELTSNQRTVQYVLISSEEVKKSLKVDAKDLSRLDEVRKISDELAAQVVLTAAGSDKKAESKINGLVKAYGTALKSTGWISGDASFLPEIGEASDLVKDAFAANSPLDLKKGGTAKKYVIARGVLVAWVSDSKQGDLSQWETQRGTLMKQLTAKKQRDLYEGWMKKIMSKAKVDPNPAVLGDSA